MLRGQGKFSTKANHKQANKIREGLERIELERNKEHIKDSDCTLDNTGKTCIVCGVYHGEPCIECKQRGYHKTDCSLSDANNGCSKCALSNVECLDGNKYIPLMQLYDEPECENFKPIK